MAEMERFIYDRAAAIPVMFTVIANANAGSLRGPRVRQTPDVMGGSLDTHLFEWTR